MLSNSTILAIWQQSEYDWRQLEEWYALHKDDDIHIEPEKWTAKLKLIARIVNLLFFLPSLTRFKVALAVILPFENFLRRCVYLMATMKLALLKRQGLIVVAIAGSYGKTSTKQILQHTFSATHQVLVTPKSINTLLGIAQVILKDLKLSHQLFIVEFGEYHPQDIPQLTQFVKPHYGVLTPIGRQHLAIIGGFEQLITTFKKFIAYFASTERLLVAEENQHYFKQKFANTYGQKQSNSQYITNVLVTRRGTEFDVHIPGQNASQFVYMPLFGAHQAVNTLPAFWLGKHLHIDAGQIAQQCTSLPFIHRRHEPTFAENNVLVLDNSYNTNPDSAKASLQLLEDLKPSRKLIVTMGFTELGEDSPQIHRAFGKELAEVVDYVGIIDTPNAKYIMEGFEKAGGKKSHVMIGKDMDEAVQLLSKFIVPDSVILLEGGYRELYT